MTNHTDTTTDIETQRAAALLAHLQANGYADIDADDIEPTTYDETSFDTPGQEWRALTDEEADEAAAEYIRETLWAFNASFLVSYMPEGIGGEELDAIRGDRCEDANGAIVALVNAGPSDFDELVSEAIGADGRGHFLAGYDFEEHEQEHAGRTWFLYRTN